MKAILTPEVVAVAHAAATEEDRPILTTLHIADGEAVAIDGVILVRADCKTEGEGEMNIPAQILLAFAALIPHTLASPVSDIVAETFEGNKIKLSTIPEGLVLVTSQIEGKYPLYKNLIPENKERGFIALKVGLLKHLLESCDEESIIAFKIRGTEQPVEFITNHNARGAIMPMLTMGMDISPRWNPVKESNSA